jgi:ABC-type dipeptide/oligopeptide/nickel transport system permease subunit
VNGPKTEDGDALGDARAPRAAFRRLRSSHKFVIGLAIVLLLVAFSLLGPVLSSHDAYTSDFVGGLTKDSTPVGPSSVYWLGTDRIYRDELVRLALGGRLSLFIGIAATAIATLIGGAVGIVAGYFEGTVVDGALMRLVDVVLAFPFLLLVMMLGVVFEKTTPLTVLLTLGLTGWLGTARIIRAKAIQVRTREYVEAARALGQRTPGILLRHVLPNVSGPLLVIATISVAQMIIAESVLSYLGAGLAPPTPTWGHMLFEGQDYYLAAPWLVAAPATVILASVLGFNLLGEGLRDALDPRAD